MALTDPKEILLMIHEINSQYYPKLWYGGSKFGLSAENAASNEKFKNLGPPIPKFLENIGCYYPESSRVPPWDHFKPHVSRLEQVVWILDT